MARAKKPKFTIKRNRGTKQSRIKMLTGKSVGKVKVYKKKGLSSTKARLMLHEGKARGHKLTGKQRRLFGLIASGKKPTKSKKKDGYKRVIDNKMKDYGEIDEKKKVIRIRKKPFKTKKWKKGEVLDSIVHEETHRKHPKMLEKTVYKKAKKAKRDEASAKKKLYDAIDAKIKEDK